MRTGVTLLTIVVLVAVAAPFLAPNDPDRVHRDFSFAPPSTVYVIDRAGTMVPPYTYPQRLVSRLERRYAEDRSRPEPIRWFHRGRLVTVSNAAGRDAAPLFLLGADSFGRDVCSRLLYAARTSLLLAFGATLGAIILGVVIGGTAGAAGGLVDEVLTRFADFVLVLPAIYVVLALRAVMPLVLPDRTVFILMAGIFAAVGWPFVARGVRAFVASERSSEYAHAARALGAGPVRVLARHLLPATGGYLLTQATLLIPAFILAEATMSYVGLGFSDRTPSWGSMLHDAANVAVLGDFPWVLAPAGAIFIVVLAVNLIVQAPLSSPTLRRPT